MTGHADRNISIRTLPALKTLFELDEISHCEFSYALKTGDLYDPVVIRPDVELNASWFLNESVLEDTKVTLSERSGSSIHKDSPDPYFTLVNEFQDVVCRNSPYVLPPDRGERHATVLAPGTKYCVRRQWHLL